VRGQGHRETKYGQERHFVNFAGHRFKGQGNRPFQQRHTSRVVSSEISLGKFPEIYFNLSGNLLNIFSLYNV